MRFRFIAITVLASILSTNVAELIDRQTANNSITNSSASPTSSTLTLPTGGLAPTVNSSIYDLSQHYCRLWRHASAFVNITSPSIYIDSGDTYTPQGNGTFYNTAAGEWNSGQNVNLLVINLSKNFTENDTFPYRTIHKPQGVPPALEDSALLYSASSQKLYQVGGWFSRNGNPSTAGYVQSGSIPPSAIWEYDIEENTWKVETEFKDIDTGSKIDRPGAAAHCDAPTLNQSYVFGGFVQQFSDPDYASYPLYDTFKFLEGMLKIDTEQAASPVLTNISVPTYLQPRTDGSLIHVPVGQKGILVQVGGQTTANGSTPWGVPIAGAAGGNIMTNLTQIDLYDIESGYWFRQSTSVDGDNPPPAGRAALCLALIAAPDGSSYNIIMVGGVLTYDGGTSTQEIWALSLPTFRWFRLFGKNGALYRHTCHLIGENLLIIGGMERNLPTGDEDLTTCQSSMPARIFSIPQNNFTGVFDYDGSLRPAPVPSPIYAYIGGTATGGAVRSAPAIWDNAYLQYVFNPAVARPSYTPDPANYILAIPQNVTNTTDTNTTAPATSSPAPTHHSETNTGAIAGGVVGGVFGLVFFGALMFVFIIRPQKKNKEKAVNELPSYQEAKSHVPPVEIPDHRYSRNVVNGGYGAVEMPTPQPQSQSGTEERDSVTPMIREPHNERRDHWGREIGAVGAIGAAGASNGHAHRRVGSGSRFSEVSDESGGLAGSGRGSVPSPPVSPGLGRREAGTTSRQSARGDGTA